MRINLEGERKCVLDAKEAEAMKLAQSVCKQIALADEDAEAGEAAEYLGTLLKSHPVEAKRTRKAKEQTAG